MGLASPMLQADGKPSIHLIKKTSAGLPPIEPVPGEARVYTSGYWKLAEEVDLSLIGGNIYFHERQSEPSFFGGQILDAKRVEEGIFQERIVFKFLYSQACRGVRSAQGGWSQEMKIVR